MESVEGIVFREDKAYDFFKRAFDIVISFVLIILFSWLFLLIAIMIKLTSKGPVIYKSKRIGENGIEFNFYKFRSMRVNADKELSSLRKYNETNGVTFKMKNDPRVTKVGRILRKTSLDELPQLINVLNGTMTLVGPRPALPDEVSKYDQRACARLQVKQGITCIWQCSGRSNVSFQEQINMDLEYIKKRCFMFDIVLLVKTFFSVIFGKGAE